MMRLVVAITGASGAMYGIRLLEVLKEKRVETDLVITKAAETIICYETDKSVEELKLLGTRCHNPGDFMAPIASGSCKFSGMVIIPCSMKTLGGIASGFAYNLVLRAADVALKERRKLILVPRETPLNVIHLKNMLKVALAGAIILPRCLHFIIHPKQLKTLLITPWEKFLTT